MTYTRAAPTKVTLVCTQCGHTARRPLQRAVACRGTHETPSEMALCPNGHGVMVRQDGVQQLTQAKLDRIKTKG
jgi:hypothetical protein